MAWLCARVVRRVTTFRLRASAWWAGALIEAAILALVCILIVLAFAR